MAVAKADTLSGDQQVGIAGRELGAPLRVMVTRDDVPVPGVPLLAVAVKVAVELRLLPSTRAVADWGPVVGPKVQTLELRPSASV
jgi:hypothetical protein